MTTVQDMLERVLSVNVVDDSKAAIEETAVDYMDKQEKQLYSGIDSYGEEISPSYKPLTIFIKKQKGQPIDRVTLKDTGSFYAGMYMQVTKDVIEIDSEDEKSAALQKKYGESIFGLSEKIQDEYVEQNLEPVFMDMVKEKLQL